MHPALASVAAAYPDAIYRRIPLPEDQNALQYWMEGFTDLLQLTTRHRELLSIDAASQLSWFVADPRVSAALSAAAPALELIDLGIGRGRVQFPEVQHDAGRVANGALTWTALLQCFHCTEIVCLMRAKTFAAAGDVTAAANELRRLLLMGTMICNGDVPRTHFMVASGLRTTAAEAILYLATGAALGRELLVSLVADLTSSTVAAAGLPISVQINYCLHAVPKLARLPTKGSLTDLIDAFLACYLGDQSDDVAVRPWRLWRIAEIAELLDRRRVRRRDAEVARGIAKLLRGHAEPLDAAATIRLLGQHVAALVQQWRGPRTTNKLPGVIAQTISQIQAWPLELSPIGVTVRSRCSLRRADLERARQELAKIMNPMGLLFAANSFGSQAEWIISGGDIATSLGTSAVIASVLFRRERGRLPDNLEELVDEGLVREIPRDPFCNGALHYSSERRAIWSCEPGGENDSKPGDEMVWRIPGSE